MPSLCLHKIIIKLNQVNIQDGTKFDMPSVQPAESIPYSILYSFGETLLNALLLSSYLYRSLLELVHKIYRLGLLL